MAHLSTVDLAKHPIKLNTSAGEIHTRTLIMASGASARWLGSAERAGADRAWVSARARRAMGSSSRDKDIAVIGGGDSAMEEALFLTRFASKVTLIHRREHVPRFKDHAGARDGASEDSNSCTNTTVEEVLGVEEKEVKG